MTPDAEGLLRLRALHGEPAEMAAIQAVLEAAPQYYEAVTGGPAEAQSTFTASPPFAAAAVVLERPLARGGAAG